MHIRDSIYSSLGQPNFGEIIEYFMKIVETVNVSITIALLRSYRCKMNQVCVHVFGHGKSLRL